MRLIDADALKLLIYSNVYPVKDYFNSKDYGMFWTGGIEKAIDEMPTVDAMPVEWLKENFPISEVYGTENYFRNAYAVQRVLKLWEKEKEKREKNELR